jgi:hypothetical protein
MTLESPNQSGRLGRKLILFAGYQALSEEYTTVACGSLVPLRGTNCLST